MEQKKQKIGYIIFMLAVCLWSVFLFAACQTPATWQEQYDLGMRYLTESNYEEAILESVLKPNTCVQNANVVN